MFSGGHDDMGVVFTVSGRGYDVTKIKHLCAMQPETHKGYEANSDRNNMRLICNIKMSVKSCYDKHIGTVQLHMFNLYRYLILAKGWQTYCTQHLN